MYGSPMKTRMFGDEYFRAWLSELERSRVDPWSGDQDRPKVQERYGEGSLTNYIFDQRGLRKRMK